MAIVKASYIRRGRTGQQAAKKTRQAAKYYTFRSGPDRLTRIWHTSDRRTGTYADLSAEMAASATAYAYTYRVVLSTKEADITADGYHQVLAGRFECYYFIEHHLTAFPHAHVIGFRSARIKKAELQALRGRVQALEQAQARQLQHTPVQGQEAVLPARGRPQVERAHERGIDGPGGM